MHGQTILCFLISELIYLSADVAKTNPRASRTVSTNVLFGHASRGLDHAAIQGVRKAQLHEPQGGSGGTRGREQER